MKVGIITYHNPNNYGALCQAVASRVVFSQFGIASIIDYQNDFISGELKVVRFKPTIAGAFRAIKDLLRYSHKRVAIKSFEKFLRDHGNLTEPANDQVELKRVSHDFDVLVSGSDQVWNPHCANADGSIDENYFLEFSHAGQKCISYGSSFGAHQFSPAEAERVKKYLKKFTALSVREKEGAQYLENLLKRKVECVLDPTLLLSEDDWSQYCTPIELPDKYVLIYIFNRTKLSKTVVERVRNATDLPVVVIDQELTAGFECVKHIRSAGPGEFLHAFKNASYVVTDSFHGCCFSVNFGKKFIAVSPGLKSNRIKSLFGILGCESRLVCSDEDAQEIHVEHEVSPVSDILRSERERCMQYISDAMKIS